MSPYLAEFIGTMNIIVGKVITQGKVQIESLELICDTGTLAVGSSVSLCVRPEDIHIGSSQHDDNRVVMVVNSLTFMGSHFGVVLVADQASALSVEVDLSKTLVNRLQITQGSSIEASLPQHIITVFGIGDES